MVDKLSNNLELKMCLFIVDLALCFSDTNVSYSRVTLFSISFFSITNLRERLALSK